MDNPPLRQVNQREYLAYIQQFPDRLSSRSGMAEPPVECCMVNDRRIGLIRLCDAYHKPNEYFIEDRD